MPGPVPSHDDDRACMHAWWVVHGHGWRCRVPFGGGTGRITIIPPCAPACAGPHHACRGRSCVCSQRPAARRQCALPSLRLLCRPAGEPASDRPGRQLRFPTIIMSDAEAAGRCGRRAPPASIGRRAAPRARPMYSSAGRRLAGRAPVPSTTYPSVRGMPCVPASRHLVSSCSCFHLSSQRACCMLAPPHYCFHSSIDVCVFAGP
jgi:hypothetical protein